LLAFACLAFVFIDHLLVPAPLPAQRRITRRASLLLEAEMISSAIK